MGSYNSLAQPLKVFNFFSPKSLHPTGEGGGLLRMCWEYPWPCCLWDKQYSCSANIISGQKAPGPVVCSSNYANPWASFMPIKSRPGMGLLARAF